MRDGEARCRIEETTDRSILVEAAAGTGKTTLIIERIVRGIRDGALELPETVAITFTEKAAGELEERLRRRLSRGAYRADLPAEQTERLRAGLSDIDRAHISTIHSFCARLLRERPAEAGVDPDFTVLEQTPAALLREEAWREWMDVQVAEAPWALVEALRAGVRARQLQELAYALADAPEILEIPRFRLPRPEGDRREIVRAIGEAALPAARAAEELMKGSGNPESRALRDAAQAIADAAPEDESAIRRAAYPAARADLAKALKSFRGDRDAARAALEPFSEAARRLGSHLAAHVFQWTAGFVEHYRRVKRSRSALDFQDLLLIAARLLRNDPEVRRYFQRRFRAFFVDEFQDTDPLQAELIGYLCEDRTGSPADRLEEVCLEDGVLMAVGDPKQSIYRFRRADVQMYEQFKRLFGQQRIENIYCNFRSDSPLLRWFNRLFEVLFSPPEDEKVYQAEHVPLARGLEEQRRGGPGVAAVCPSADLSKEGWNAARARAWEAHHLARLVQQAVEGELRLPHAEDSLSYGSFAFLLRALTDVDIYEEALDAHDVPYRVVGGKHFYRRSQTEETLCLLRAIDDPLDEPAIVGALRSSYFGISDEELLRHRAGGGLWNYLRNEESEGPVGEALSLMARWHGLRNRVPPPVLLGKVFDETRARHAYMLKPAGEQRAAALEQLQRRLRSLGQSARTFGAVVRHLSSIEEADLPEEESSSVEPGEDFVQLLSMHKAKGLEFPVVVLPDLGRSFPRKGRVGSLLFDRRDGRVGLRVHGGIETPDYDALQTEEHGNQMAELRRLLYVACTRAERLLVLPLYWYEGRGESFQKLLEGSGCVAQRADVPLGQDIEGVHYVDTRGWAKGVDITPQPRPLPKQEKAEVRAQMAERSRWLEHHRRLAERASAGRRFLTPSSLDAPFRPGTADETPGRWAGRDFGSLFHDLMQAIPLGAGAPDGERVRGLARLAADRLGLAPEAAREAASLALAALRVPEFEALLDESHVLEKEVPLCVPLSRLQLGGGAGGCLVEGSIDLLARVGSRTVILDYKTDSAPAPERYWPQVGLYGLAARACGYAGEDLELALFFVREGSLYRRRVDAELTRNIAALAAELARGESGRQ